MPKKDIEYGELIRRARKLNNLTQRELGDRLGVSQGLIAQWETGHHDPPEDRRQRLESILGISKETRDLEDVEGPSEFATWMKRAREDKELSVPVLAKKAGVTPKTIYDIEDGRVTNPQEKTIKRLERILETDVPSEIREEMVEESRIEGIGEWKDFDISDEETHPTGSGVYIFFARNKIPLYVGESGKLKKRFSSYRDKYRKPSWTDLIEKSVYVEINDEKVRQGVERLLIKYVAPIVNKQHVDSGAEEK